MKLWSVSYASVVLIYIGVLSQNVVALVMIIVRWAIPDMSGELRDRIRREAYIINTFILDETRGRFTSAAGLSPR